MALDLFFQVIAVLAVLVAAAALLRARRLSRRVERLSESYWELRYEHGQLRARLTALEPPPGNVLSRLAQQVVIVMIPPLALIFLVLGTIFVGIATPTEGGAMGASGALIMALAKRRLSWSLLRQAMNSTAKLSSFVMFILIGSSVFTLTFRGVNGDLWFRVAS